MPIDANELVPSIYALLSQPWPAGVVTAPPFGLSLNAAWYGCVPDGNFTTGAGTENAPAFQNALNALSNVGGGLLVVPPGVYKCSSQIQVPSGVTVQGAGMWGTMIFAPTAFANAGGLIAINGYQGSPGYPTVWDGISVIGQFNGCGGCGIVSTKNGVIIKNAWFNGFSASGSFAVVLNQTDNFLVDCVAELNWGGVEILQNNITVRNLRTYQNQTTGVYISNGTGTGQGRVLITDLRSTDEGQNAIVIASGSKNISVSGDASSTLNSRYSNAAISITAATDVKLNGFTATLAAGASTAPGILMASGTGISVMGGTVTGFYDGVQATATGLLVTGGQYTGNSRHGVNMVSGDQVNVGNNNCSGNGGNGIFSQNSGPVSSHSVVGNMTNGNTGYGILANMGINSSATNVQANMMVGNATGQIQYTVSGGGTMGQFNQGVTPTNF